MYAPKPQPSKKKAKMLVKSVPAMDLGPEKKYIDTTANSAFSYSAGAPLVAILNGVAEGSDNTNRLGRKVLMKSIEFRCAVTHSTTQTAVRALLVYDKQTNGAAPAVSDILSVPGSANDPYACRNLNNVERFIIIWDEFFEADPTTTVVKCIKHFNFVSLPVRYGTTAAGVAGVTSGGLFLIFIDSNTGASVNTANYTCRVKFTDL